MLARARLVGPCLLALVGTAAWTDATAIAAAPSSSTDVPRKASTPPPPGTPAPPKDVQAPEPRSATTPPPPSGGSSVPPPPPGKSDVPGTAPAVEPERPPVDLSSTWSRSRGGGSGSPRFVRSSDDARAIDTPNPEGYYSGVSVEGNHVPPFPAPKMGTKPALLTWTGFERTSGGSRVFFEVSAAVATKLAIKGSTLTLRIANTKINVKNNTRHLDLRYFRTPVSTVKVKRSGKDTIATIVLKRGAEPKVSLVDGKAGYKLLVVEFADAGGDAPAPTPPPP